MESLIFRGKWNKFFTCYKALSFYLKKWPSNFTKYLQKRVQVFLEF